MTVIFQLHCLVMNKDILYELQTGRSTIGDLDRFYIEPEKIVSVCNRIRSLFFPEHFPLRSSEPDTLNSIREDLNRQILRVDLDYQRITNEFMDRLPKIQQMVYKDLTAIYNGDPSAKTCTEIILSFPGFLAILFHRIAHEFYELDVPILPRLISEHVHEKTGIDIHPGAKIGESFCIDHGTGVVVGETAVIGDHVRIYHGVTLGVRNFRKDEDGNLLKGGKRHPNIGNRVIIYANATILGGDTFIKDDSVIPAGSMILHTPETFL